MAWRHHRRRAAATSARRLREFDFKATHKEFGPKPNTVTMTGRFTDHGKKVSGTVSYEGADDRVTCKSGTLTYTAKLSKKKPSSGR